LKRLDPPLATDKIVMGLPIGRFSRSQADLNGFLESEVADAFDDFLELPAIPATWVDDSDAIQRDEYDFVIHGFCIG
jgi:hypothetical protein